MKSIFLKHLNHLIFSILFITGLYFAKDFGITWDEAWHRLRGIETLAFVAKKLMIDKFIMIPDYIPEISSDHHRYGALFDTSSAFIEKAFSIKDKKDVFIMRHRLNFCFYFFGFYFFYLLIKNFFGGKWIPILLSMFYLLNPRLLAHGFFNGKDSIAQAFVCCTIFPIFLFHKTKDIKWVFLAGFYWYRHGH